MGNIYLSIGSTDLSEWVEVESYSVSKNWVEAANFKALNGDEIIKYSGFYYEISVDFKNVPTAVMGVIASAAESDKYTVAFTDMSGGRVSAEFLRAESVQGEIARKLNGDVLWNTSLSVRSEFMPADGEGL